MPTMLDPAATAARIDAASDLVLTTHARADGDAVGSLLALRRVLSRRGKAVRAFVHEEVLERYAFLTRWEPVEVWDPATGPRILGRTELLVLVDTCTKDQLREMAGPIRSADVPKLAIDHHVTRQDIVDAVLVDEQAGATAQIITRLCDTAGWRIDRETAAMLYTGLATDTGWFRFSNASAEVYAAAARLIEAGARPNDLYERLYLNDCPERARLAGTVLTSFELLADGRLAVVRLSREAIAACGATHQMTEELINEPQRVGSVNVCVLFIEPAADGWIRVSFRSKHDVDVAALAARFGGGGHERAAGVRINGTMESVTALVIPAALEVLGA